MTVTDHDRPVRDEVEVAADTVAALVLAGVIAIGKLQVAADAAGLMTGEVHAALRRRELLGFLPPRHTQLATGPSTPVGSQPEQPPQPGVPEVSLLVLERTQRPSHFNAGRRPWNKKAEHKTRECIKCGLEKPIGEFLPRSDSNSRRTECDDCRKNISRQRYLSVEASERLGVVLRFIVEQGDPVEGDGCSRCHGRLAVGDEVETDDIVLVHHHICPEGN